MFAAVLVAVAMTLIVTATLHGSVPPAVGVVAMITALAAFWLL